MQVGFLGCEDPLRREWQPTPVLWPGKSHGWKSLVGCSAWGRSELDTPEHTLTAYKRFPGNAVLSDRGGNLYCISSGGCMGGFVSLLFPASGDCLHFLAHG